MSRGLNKVMLIGNAGNDPEIKYTAGGMAAATLSPAASSVRKDRDGNQVEQTQWHRVKFFGKLAEIVGEYIKKGKPLYVEGSIRYDKYTDKEGVEKYTTEIIADEMQMLGGRDEGGGERRPAARDERSSRPERSARPERSRPEPAPKQDFADDFADDDIPF